MNLMIQPALLKGAVAPPPSKSQSHRFLLCAALADGESVIDNVALNQDIQATLRCMEALGVAWRQGESSITVQGLGGKGFDGPLPHFDCGESGSTLRFMIPLSLALTGGGVFTGHGRLMQRPQNPYQDLFQRKGVYWAQESGVLTVRGRLASGEYHLPGDVSSQFFTGLLLALPLLDGPSALVPTTRLESMGYVAMTLDAIERFGILIPTTRTLPPKYMISGGERYVPRRLTVEGDWSQAAFWYAANALGSEIDILGMNHESMQWDAMAAKYCQALGKPGEVEIDMTDHPDLAPPLAAAAAMRRGDARFTGIARLRLKESDRAAAIREVLTALGTRVEEGPDTLVIHGAESLRGGCQVDCRNDHRIAMMAAVAATRCREPVTLLGAECVGKSYPDFWKHYRMLGGNFREHVGK